MARPRRRSGRRGFTLVEVLIALAIFALSAVVLAGTYLNIVNAYERLDKGGREDPFVQMARQELLTQTDLTTAEAGDEWDSPQPLMTPGTVAMPPEHVKWTADIEPTTTTDLFTVTFTCVVTPPGAQSPATDTETFMLLRPTWSVPTDRQTLRQNNATQIAILQGKQQK